MTVAAVLGFSLAPSSAAGSIVASLRLDLMCALLVGGVIAAPIAPYVVTSLKPQVLGVTVGGFVVLTNLRVVLHTAASSGALPSEAPAVGMSCWAVVWVAASLRVALRVANNNKDVAPDMQQQRPSMTLADNDDTLWQLCVHAALVDFDPCVLSTRGIVDAKRRSSRRGKPSVIGFSASTSMLQEAMNMACTEHGIIPFLH